MNALLIVLALAAAFLLLAGGWAVHTSNSLIAKRNRVKQCGSGILVALKQRNDLLPNLVATVKTYMGHENETLTRIAELRSRAATAAGDQPLKEGTELSALLARLQVEVEAYPELKTNEQFRFLQRQVEEMENQLQAIRRTYNAAVTDYNNSIEMFPASLIASWQKHRPEALVEIPETETQAIDLNRLFNQA